MLTKKLSLIIIGVLLASSSFGAPAPSGVSGTVSDGQSITITGTGFGATGPTVILFDDYESGTNGNNISTTTSTIGNWSVCQGETYYPKYSNEYAHSGTLSQKNTFRRINDDGYLPQMQLNEFSGGTNVTISFWLYMATDSDVPGTNNANGPNWKVFWLFGPSFPQSDYSQVWLGNDFTQEGYWTFGTEDDLNPPTRVPSSYIDTNFRKGQWTRFFHHYTWGTNNNGAIESFETNVFSGGQHVLYSQSGITTGHTGENWETLTLPGYGRNDSNSVAYYDDVYVATGTGARARVEIGNNATYTSCTNLTVCTPTSWSDTSITATVRGGSFTSGTAYLFVTDASGVTSAGKEITFGSEEEDTTPTIRSGGIRRGGIR